ncbi:MAG: VOC family protein [Solirubrobacterales bacterium]
MIHHVALETDPEVLAEEILFWQLAGFVEVPVPTPVDQGHVWLEREGTQVHLMSLTDPTVPLRGHVAIVAPDFDATLRRLRSAGFELQEGRELWGERRAKARTPAGHTVELMAAPPAPRAG